MTAAIIRAMGCRMTGQSATINWRQVRQDLRIPPELVCVVVLVLAYAWWDSAVALDAWARDVPRRLRARYILDPACIGDHGARGAQ